MISMTKHKKKKAPRIDWKARAQKAERVAKAAIEFEYRNYLNYQTYTNREAAEIAHKRHDEALNDLQWVLRDTGLIKRD